MTKNKIYIFTSIILFCGFFLVRPQYSSFWTEGIPKMILNFGLWVISGGLILIYTVYWYNKADRPNYNFLPIGSFTLIILIFSFGSAFKSLKFDGPNKLTAQLQHSRLWARTLLKLQENNCYLLELDQIEWTSLFYSGTYKYSNDTIIFDKDLRTLTRYSIDNIYVLTTDNKYLIPIIKGKSVADTTQWFTVEN